IERENMNEKLFEVPAQLWADITDSSGEFGVSVLSECKYGWDKFNNNTLRLTALHTPKKNYRIDSMQSLMDLGKNIYSFAVCSHSGKVGTETQKQARIFTTPLTAVRLTKHKGELGREYSFGKISDDSVIIRCLKKKYHSDKAEYVVRFNEGANKEVKNFEFTLGEGIDTAYEAWASEEYFGEAKVEKGKLICDFKPYEIKTFVFTLKESKVKGSPLSCKPVELKGNAVDEEIPENLKRSKITACGITFETDKQMKAGGEVLPVAEGKKLALLCTNFRDNSFVNNAFEAYARWDLYDFKETAYIKEGQLGYEFTHTVLGDAVKYARGEYYWIKILNAGEALPNDEDVHILAATEIDDLEAELVTPLMDKIENNRPFTFKKNLKEKWWYFTSKLIWNINDKDDYFFHNNNGKNGKRVEQTGNRFQTKKIEL
ncbi:MAG: hypothetical protein IKS12_07690, partial [Eubacterium sp.]|nr:hypothetical protein [Eubacterium sp.]